MLQHFCAAAFYACFLGLIFLIYSYAGLIFLMKVNNIVMIDSRTIFIAHRGESYDAPENTLAALRLAWQRNDDAVEIDVHLSQDEKIVVIHNDDTLKFSGISHKVKDQTLEELQRLDVGKYKGDRWANERIPTLAEALSIVPKQKMIFIEIKSDIAIVPRLETVIGNSGLESAQVKIIGFDLDVMAAVRQALSDVEVFLVRNIKYLEMKTDWLPEINRIVAEACEAGLQGLDVSDSTVIDQSMVRLVKHSGLKFYVWTVNDPQEAQRLIIAGVDGIASDRAHWLKQQVGVLKL